MTYKACTCCENFGAATTFDENTAVFAGESCYISPVVRQHVSLRLEDQKQCDGSFLELDDTGIVPLEPLGMSMASATAAGAGAPELDA